MDHRIRSQSRRPLRAALTAAGLLLVLPALAAEPAAPYRSPLEGIKDLEKPVTYTETKIRLGELVRKVAADTGQPLTAAPEVANEPVAVVVKELPARELLEELARLLDYHWRAEGSAAKRRYIVYQDIAAKQAEESLREARRKEVEQQFQNDLQQVVAMSALSQDSIAGILRDQERHQQDLQARSLSAGERRAPHASLAEKDRSQHAESALQLWSPVSRAVAHLLGRLSAQQWVALRGEGQLVFSSDPQPGELALPEEEAHRLRECRPRMDLPTFRPSSLEEADSQRAFEQRQQDEWAAATGYRVVIQLDSGELERRGRLNLTADVMGTRSDDPNSASAYRHSGDNSVTISAALDLSQEIAADETPERRAALAQDPVVGVRKRFKQDDTHKPEHFGWKKGPLRFQELLPDIARIYGVQIISDAYWSDPPSQPPVVGDEPIALFELLDNRAGFRQHWDHQGDLVRLRSRTWFLDRPREVPLRLVRRWKQMGETLGALPLDQYLEIGRTLTDPQLECLGDLVGQEVFPEELNELGNVADVRYALRLLASLSPEQRQIVWNGGSLPLAAMSVPKRELFAAAFREHNRFLGSMPAPISDCEDGTLSLATSLTARTVTVSEEPGGGRGATINGDDDGAMVIPPAAGPGHAGRRSRHAVTRVTLRFVCGPNVARQASFVVASERSGSG